MVRQAVGLPRAATEGAANEQHQDVDPEADEQGYVFRAAVDENEEMVEMLEASRQYQNNVEVVSTLRSLMMRTISMGK